MKNLSRSQTIGLVAVVGTLGVVTAGSALKSGKSSSSPPIVMTDPNSAKPLTPPISVGLTPDSANNSSNFGKSGETLPPKTDAPPVASEAKSSELVVHVTGAVKKPGVYHLPAGARGDDAVKAAGGTLATANVDALNLAAHIEDGSQIHVPTKKEIPLDAPPAPDSLVKRDPTVSNSANSPTSSKTGSGTRSTYHAKTAGSSHRTGGSSRGSGGSKSDKLTADSNATINLNTASLEELQRLPGIGPAMAERILDYRKETGGFKTPDELMQVKGIGAKKFAKMERFVRVK